MAYRASTVSTGNGSGQRNLPAAFRERIFQKGQSGNPGGRGGEYHQMLRICRERSVAAALEIAKLAEKSDDERVRYMAATWICERAWGKAKDFDPKSEHSGPRFDPSLLTPEQLDQVEAAMRLMLAATRPPDSPAPASSEPVVEVEDEAVEVETDSGK